MGRGRGRREKGLMGRWNDERGEEAEMDGGKEMKSDAER